MTSRGADRAGEGLCCLPSSESRSIQIGAWTGQQARNLLMDLGEQTYRVKFMIRDRGSNFTGASNAVLAGASIRTVLCNVRTPRMNAIAERWIGGCRRELLDRTLIWNQDHPRRIPHQYGTHHNQHRPHRSLHDAAPLKPLPETGRPRPVPRPKAGSRRWPDQRISPGRMTWTRFRHAHQPGHRQLKPSPWPRGRRRGAFVLLYFGCTCRTRVRKTVGTAGFEPATP